MESLQFHCLNTAVSLLSKQDMQKILSNRAIQIEKTRLSKYLEDCDADFSASVNQIKVMAASQTELPSFPAEAKPVYIVSQVNQDVRWCSYVVSREIEEQPLQVFAWWRKSGNGASDVIVNKFQINMSYGESSGTAEIICSEYKGVPRVRDTLDCDQGIKNILTCVASDLGLCPTDTNLLRLIEMFYGSDVVRNWGSIIGGRSFLDIIRCQK